MALDVDALRKVMGGGGSGRCVNARIEARVMTAATCGPQVDRKRKRPTQTISIKNESRKQSTYLTVPPSHQKESVSKKFEPVAADTLSFTVQTNSVVKLKRNQSQITPKPFEKLFRVITQTQP
jgi:hypothetical protein